MPGSVKILNRQEIADAACHGYGIVQTAQGVCAAYLNEALGRSGNDNRATWFAQLRNRLRNYSIASALCDTRQIDDLTKPADSTHGAMFSERMPRIE